VSAANIHWILQEFAAFDGTQTFLITFIKPNNGFYLNYNNPIELNI